MTFYIAIAKFFLLSVLDACSFLIKLGFAFDTNMCMLVHVIPRPYMYQVWLGIEWDDGKVAICFKLFAIKVLHPFPNAKIHTVVEVGPRANQFTEVVHTLMC